MDVENGTNVGECRNGGIKTRIVLVCNSSVVWSSQNLTRIIHVEKIGQCEVNILTVLFSIKILLLNTFLHLYSMSLFCPTMELARRSSLAELSSRRSHTKLQL